ncbi:MAG TPA: hypothetical protein VGW34_11695, partial [Allosphingosinicella sp.]|nr:hypothetical protein [Allosphingosinicella sp.]
VQASAAGPEGAAADAPVPGAPPAGLIETSAVAAPEPSDAGPQTLAIVDSQGFGQAFRAATIEVPASWRAEGGIGWDRSTNCVASQMKIQWRASSPDRRQAFELMPGFSWQFPEGAMQMNPCPVAGIRSARDFLSAAVQQMRPGARVLQYRDRPDLGGGQQSGQPGQRAEAGEVVIAYGGPSGETHEILSAAVSFSSMSGNTVGLVSYIASLRAPAGQLDPELGRRLQRSLKPDPQYLAMVQQAGTQAANDYGNRQRQEIDSWHAGRMADINARGAADRAAIRAQTSRDVAAINSQTHANTMATNDRINETTRQGLMEESTWVNPQTGSTYQGSIHGADRVIQLDDGSFVRSDDPYYNPSGSVEYEPQ